jgi:hypothetical protein
VNAALPLRYALPCLYSLLLVACGGGAASGAASGAAAAGPATPQSFWASQPVAPDETVLAATGNTDATSTVQVALLSNASPGTPGAPAPALQWQPATVLQASATSVKFLIPASWPKGVYAYQIQSHGLASPVALLNAPDITFIQGDQGDSASPGGWIQVHGTSIAMAGQSASLDLVLGGQLVATLAPDASGNAYAQRFLVPASVAAGSYQVYVHNGAGGPAAWTQYQAFFTTAVNTFAIAPAAVWPSTVFDVTRQAGTTTDARVAAAIAAARANGGGVIYFPAGAYTLTTQLNLPDHTILRGAAQASAVLTWTAVPADPTAPGTSAKALVQGALLSSVTGARATFSIDNLSLIGAPAFSGHAVDTQYSNEPAWLRNASIRLPYISAKLAGDVPTAVYLRHRHNFAISASSLDAMNTIDAHDDVCALLVQNSTLDWRNETIFLSGASHGFIISGNVFNLRGTAATNGWTSQADPNPGFWFTSFYGTSIGGPFTRDLYYAGNSSTRDESELPPAYVGITFDGGQGIYLGGVAGVDGTTLSLAGRTLVPADGSTYEWAGAVVQVLDGTGAGQWRYLTQAGPGQGRVTIDRAWDIAPDATSTVSLLNLQGRVLMIGNDFAQEQTNQEYYFAMDVINAQNTYGVTGATTQNYAWIGRHYDGLSPGWHNQVLDNSVVRGDKVNLVAAVQTATPGYAGRVGAYQVFRNNRAAAGIPATISFVALHGRFDDIVSEKNSVTDLNLGPVAGDPLDFVGVVLRKNAATLDGNLSAGGALDTPGIVFVP